MTIPYRVGVNQNLHGHDPLYIHNNPDFAWMFNNTDGASGRYIDYPIEL